MNRLEKIYQLATELRLQIVSAMSEGLIFYAHNTWARDEKILKSIADWALTSMTVPKKTQSSDNLETTEN